VANLSADAKAQLETSSFAVIVCHNLLEYMDDPETVLSSIKILIKPGGIVSILVRNRAGEVLKAAIKSGDLEQATRNLTTESVKESLYGGDARLFDPGSLRDSLMRSSLETIAERGVRVMSDYLPAKLLSDDAGYNRVLALEQQMGRRAEYAAIARYTQLIAILAGN
jgi:S-adenosylmethionine-dependent methyltransferase